MLQNHADGMEAQNKSVIFPGELHMKIDITMSIRKGCMTQQKIQTSKLLSTIFATARFVETTNFIGPEIQILYFFTYCGYIILSNLWTAGWCISVFRSVLDVKKYLVNMKNWKLIINMVDL